MFSGLFAVTPELLWRKKTRSMVVFPTALTNRTLQRASFVVYTEQYSRAISNGNTTLSEFITHCMLSQLGLWKFNKTKNKGFIRQSEIITRSEERN
jgi:hypothetical protein